MSDIKSTNNTPRILIVDDDRFIRKTYQDILQAAGFLPFTAPDCESALKIIKAQKPDLVILDLVMPGKDGFETCREIRNSFETRYIPVLMSTSLEDSDSIHRAFEAGATDFISKPVKPELLVYRIRCMLRTSLTVNKLLKSEASLAYSQHVAQLGNWEWNPVTGSFSGSKEISRILGLGQNSYESSLEGFLSAIYTPDREIIAYNLRTAAINKSSCSLDCHIKRADETLRTVKLHGNAQLTKTGKTSVIVGTLQDITEMRGVEDRILMLKAAVDCLPLGITIINVGGKIAYLNPAEAAMHGYNVEELIGKDACEFAPTKIRKPLTKKELNGIGLWRRETINLRKNGEQFPVQLTSVSVKDASGRCLGLVTACEDITNRKEAEKTISDLAYYDTLTGLPNRRMFMDRLQYALAMGLRQSQKVALLFIDLDDFKDINDTKGHDYGDNLLQEVAKRLKAVIRESDTLARLGGDEFVLILTSISSAESPAATAQRMLSLFSEPFTLEEDSTLCKASIGIALYPNDGMDLESLLKCADTAMYYAKEKGKDQYQFYSSEMNKRIMRRVALEKCLRQGLEKHEFFLQYQPKWDLKTRKISGVEALLRWQSAELGLMPPSEFISYTENSGLILKIGEWVLRAACKQAWKWLSEGYQELTIAVNISSRQLKQPDFVDLIKRIIHETGINPEMLELEITENVVMETSKEVVDTLEAIKRMGIQLSIDDFGTGYSCLSNLRHFSIDKVKIDRLFVAGVNRSNDDAAIVEAIIAMSHSLNLTVIAEGVENIEQLHFLTQLGCDEVQGFYLGMPMNAEDLTLRLKNGYECF